MGDDRAHRPSTPRCLGACVPVLSLAREPPPVFGIVASSTLIRFVCSRGFLRAVAVVDRPEAAGVETIFERVAGLDVHKARVTTCVRLPASTGGREQHLAEFATT